MSIVKTENLIQVIELLQDNQKIEAIKHVKINHGLGLREAKEFCEALAKIVGITLTYPGAEPAPARHRHDDGSYHYATLKRYDDDCGGAGYWRHVESDTSYDNAIRTAVDENHCGDSQFMVVRVVSRSVVNTTLVEV